MIKGGIPELLNFKQKGKNMDEFIKVPVSEKLAYCFGDPALTLMYTMTTTLLIYFYTNVVGISVGAVGMIMLVSRVFDGFSDVLTVFLAMDSYVELYKGGIVPLQEFAQMKRDNDILVRVIVKKDQRNMIYLAHRNSKTDFPVLTCAVSVNAENGCVCIGARPQKAVRLELTEAVREKVWSGVCTEEEMKKEAECIASQVKTDSNMRAGKEYRSRLAYVLIRRTLEALNTKGGDQ